MVQAQGIDWDYGLRPLQQYLAQHARALHPPSGLNSQALYDWLAQHSPAVQGVVLGQCHRVTDYGPVSLAMLCSRDIGQAAQVVAAHLLEFNSHIAFFDITEEAQHTVVEVRFRPELEQAQGVLCFHANVMAAATLRLVADLVGEQQCLLRLVLPLQPADAALSAFFQVPVAFQGASVRFHFCADFLHWPIPTANAATFEAALQACGSRLAARLEQAVGGSAQRVTQLLASCPHALPDMAAVARHLHMCERTLRRRLQAEGTSYRVLVEDAQWRRAQVLLSQEGGNVTEVARELGMGNPATLRALIRRRRSQGQESGGAMGTNP